MLERRWKKKARWRMGESTSNDHRQQKTGRMVVRKIISARSVGKRHMFDLEVCHKSHNFALSNGVITSNSHSAGYAFTAYQSAFLKTYYPAEFMASQLTVEGSFGDYETTDVYEKDLKKMKIELLPIKVNESKADYRVVDAGVDKKAIRKGYKGVSGLGGQTYVDIEAGQPYKSLIDFCQRAGNGNKKNVIEILLTEGAFDGFLDASSKRLGRRATRKDLEIELEDASKVARKLKNLKGEEKEVREIKSVFDDEEEEDFVLKP
jgi:DNA polymerase III alpha subunit